MPRLRRLRSRNKAAGLNKPELRPQRLKPIDYAAITAWVNRLREKACLSFMAEGPGLKPLEFIGYIQGAEAPCSLR